MNAILANCSQINRETTESSFHSGKYLIFCLLPLFFLWNCCQAKEVSNRKLIAQLKDKDWRIRAKAAEELGQLKSEDAIKPLIASVRDEDPDVVGAAQKALVKIGQPAVPGLIQAMKNDPFDFQTEPGLSGASKTLSMMGNEVVDQIIQSLNSNDYRIRVNSAKVLGKIRDAKAIDPLCKAMVDKVWRVRVNARWAVQKIGSPAVIPLISQLDAKDPRLREAATMALGNIKDSRAIPALKKAFKGDKNHLVRISAAWALGKLKDKSSIEMLISALSDKKRLVRASSLSALRKITGQDFGNNPQNWKDGILMTNKGGLDEAPKK